jgi:hypothetical protein
MPGNVPPELGDEVSSGETVELAEFIGTELL